MFTIAVIGPSGAGKTAWIARHVSRQFVRKPSATTVITPHYTVWNTTSGEVSVILLDCPAGVTPVADSYIHITHPYPSRQELSISPEKNTVLCVSKSDILEDSGLQRVSSVYKRFHISSCSNYNYEKPILHSLRMLLADDNLEFSTG